jgi:hypothetical protein
LLGKKCKFSHDLAVERKQEKKNLYEDARGNDKKEDTMDNWDEDKLREVVNSKHGNPKTTTDKVCKHFIDAVENQKYGWFWTCMCPELADVFPCGWDVDDVPAGPNGGDECKYKHSLPSGFVLKTKEARAAEKALMDKSPMATLTLEDFLEGRRYGLPRCNAPPTLLWSLSNARAELN